MLSAMAQCRMQIEKCKIAFCQIGTLARLHVGIGNWEMGTGNFYFLFSIFCFPFPFPSFPSLCALTRLHIDTFTC